MTAAEPRTSIPAVRADSLEMVYEGRGAPVRALDGIDLWVPRGQFVCLLGRSGCGKSTLLHLLGGLQRPTAGHVFVGDVDLSTLEPDDAARWRRKHLGMVHQFFNLIPTLSVVQNVATPLLLDGRRLRHLRDRVDELLDSLGILDRRDHRLEELSGGEMQRVAIARALMAEPELILADEPTGNMDSRTGHEILGILQGLAVEHGVTLIVATHDLTATSYANRVVTMQDGAILDDSAPSASRRA